MQNREFVFLCGLGAHRTHAQTVLELRKTTAQDGNATTDPVWFAINTEDSSRRPWTIIMMEGGRAVGAVLLRESIAFGCVPLRYFFASDAASEQFVIAPEGEREETLRLCLEALVKRVPSAIFMLVTGPEHSRVDWGPLMQGTHRDNARYRLYLEDSMDNTLKQFGTRTRRNLRYYMRDLVNAGATFHGSLTREETLMAARELSAHCDYPVSERQLMENLSVIARTPNSFVAGLRAADGEWLSCMMGWRQGKKTSVWYQMNHSEHRNASICTAMRSFFMDHEVRQGQSTELVFVAYTSKVIEGGCMEDPRHFFLLGEKSWRMSLLQMMVERTKPAEHRVRMCLVNESANAAPAFGVASSAI
jgi:hypothetical protein